MRPNWLLWGNQSTFWRAVVLLAFVRLTQKPWVPLFVKRTRIQNLFQNWRIYCWSPGRTNIYTNCQHFCLRSLKGPGEGSPPPYRPCWCGRWCWWRRSRWCRSPPPGCPPLLPPPLSVGSSSPPPLGFHFDSWGAWAKRTSKSEADESLMVHRL